GAICDAAILAPAKAELQRVLLVAAVVDNQRQSVFLHLYESWVRPSGSPSVVLLAKLPLPFNMTTPLHIVPLPEHPECFLLVTENEVAFVSALQILSGDVYLYRQNLPQLPSGDCDLVKAFSTNHRATLAFAGQLAGAAIERSPAFKRDADPAADVAQLGSTTSVSAVDYFFASGDSLDHSVIRVAGMSTPDTNADTTADAAVPTRLVRRVLTNQSPMIDFVLGSNMAYWTSGRNPGGAIHHAQFGHATGVEELIEIRANKAEDRAATLQLWHFTLPLVGPCLVLQRAQAAVAIAKDEGTGEWQVYQALQQMLV
ncbi:hypothetical protein GGH91_005085, partial [Coemansia sp. RSA 2671]